jgi:hypothetical protein
MTESIKHDRIFLTPIAQEDSNWLAWYDHRTSKYDVEYIRADIADGYCKTVNDLRTIAVNACNKVWVKIDDLQRQLAEREKQIVMMREALGLTGILRQFVGISNDYQAIIANILAAKEKALAATNDLKDCILCDAKPVGWIDGSGFPKHPSWIQGIEERRQYGKAEPLYKARKP